MKKNIKINNILILDYYISIIKQTLNTPLNVIWYGNWTAPVVNSTGAIFYDTGCTSSVDVNICY